MSIAIIEIAELVLIIILAPISFGPRNYQLLERQQNKR